MEIEGVRGTVIHFDIKRENHPDKTVTEDVLVALNTANGLRIFNQIITLTPNSIHLLKERSPQSVPQIPFQFVESQISTIGNNDFIATTHLHSRTSGSKNEKKYGL